MWTREEKEKKRKRRKGIFTKKEGFLLVPLLLLALPILILAERIPFLPFPFLFPFLFSPSLRFTSLSSSSSSSSSMDTSSFASFEFDEFFGAISSPSSSLTPSRSSSCLFRHICFNKIHGVFAISDLTSNVCTANLVSSDPISLFYSFLLFFSLNFLLPLNLLNQPAILLFLPALLALPSSLPSCSSCYSSL